MLVLVVSPETMRKEIQDAQRVVIKLGTRLLTKEDGAVASPRLGKIVSQCAHLVQEEGKKVILVSSGAVGLGRISLGIEKLSDVSAKQACAAVGQGLLMQRYQRSFARHGLMTAQLLVTADDFSDRRRYLNLRDTFERLLSYKVIPIVNENDSVSTMELQEDSRTHSFGDNDLLSALVASKLGADLLLILTDVDGIYDSNPKTNPDAKPIGELDDFDDLKKLELKGQSAYGRGGVTSKIEAARLASLSGVSTVIASGLKKDAILECAGTLVRPRLKLKGRQRWIGLSSGFGGVIQVNLGAVEALIKKKASLLPSGVTGVRGTFSANEVVSVETEQGREIGRGIVYFSSRQIAKIQGCHSREISEKLGATDHQEIIHRDHLVIFGENG
jgi:glutamate 5-kinase